MPQSIRQSEILQIVRSEGQVTVDDLVERFGVAAQTIRRDLTELDDAGKLRRVHGGAMLPTSIANIGYEERRSLHSLEKQAIAALCAQDVPEGSSVFLNIGTSTEAVAHELLRHRDLMVVTNNMNVANILAANPDCRVVVTGGQLRRSDGGLVGTLTRHAISQFKVDLAVIGCSALDEDGDMLDFDIQEVSVSQTIIRQSRKVFLVADQSKFTRTAPARIASLSEVDALYTDRPLTGDLAQRCRDWGVRIVVAGG
ncbi:MAG: DeoR/GlpR transcriptional regulator [Maritimibacter sp.]|nr:DeoR/GlpR transcriptional regulator [Maritimibacter sp.]